MLQPKLLQGQLSCKIIEAFENSLSKDFFKISPSYLFLSLFLDNAVFRNTQKYTIHSTEHSFNGVSGGNKSLLFTTHLFSALDS